LLSGLFLPLRGWMQTLAGPVKEFTDLNPDQQGRVIDEKVVVYDAPSLTAGPVKVHWKDTVFQITDVTVGDEQPVYNRVWYRADSDGYVHSGAIQPVKTRVNPALDTIPVNGAWVEVTVPYTDAYWDAGKYEQFAYRFYYETVHWVAGLTQDAAGNKWLRLLEDKWKYYYYAPAEHFRLIPDDELSPLSLDVPPDAKRLEVRLREQVVIAYEWDVAVFMARVATGAKLREGDFSTPAGRHKTFAKRAGRHMAGGDPAANGYDLPGVPWICYITETGLAFHGTYWHNDFGKPRSHGCVNLTPQAAKWIYRWTQPLVPASEQQVYENYGTAVDVVGEPE